MSKRFRPRPPRTAREHLQAALGGTILLVVMVLCWRSCTPEPASRPATPAATPYTIDAVHDSLDGRLSIQWRAPGILRWQLVLVQPGPGWEDRAHQKIMARIAELRQKRRAADARRRSLQRRAGG